MERDKRLSPSTAQVGEHLGTCYAHTSLYSRPLEEVGKVHDSVISSWSLYTESRLRMALPRNPADSKHLADSRQKQVSRVLGDIREDTQPEPLKSWLHILACSLVEHGYIGWNVRLRYLSFSRYEDTLQSDLSIAV